MCHITLLELQGCYKSMHHPIYTLSLFAKQNTLRDCQGFYPKLGNAPSSLKKARIPFGITSIVYFKANCAQTKFAHRR